MCDDWRHQVHVLCAKVRDVAVTVDNELERVNIALVLNVSSGLRHHADKQQLHPAPSPQ
jgi:hypothetical protein